MGIALVSDTSCNTALVWQNFPVHVDVTPSSEYDVSKGAAYANLLTETAGWRALGLSNYNEFIQVHNSQSSRDLDDVMLINYRLFTKYWEIT